jgi:hypothetical protein
MHMLSIFDSNKQKTAVGNLIFWNGSWPSSSGLNWRLELNSFADNFLTPARSNCQFLCSYDIPKRSPKQKKSIKMRWKTPRPGPLPILAESIRLGFIAVICSSSTILSDRELKSPIAAGSYCPIFVGSLHSTCTREHKNWQFERAGAGSESYLQSCLDGP